MSIVPDFDALFHVHREPSYSLILPIIVFTVLSLIDKPKILSIALMLYLLHILHIIIDIINGSMLILWPIRKNISMIKAGTNIEINSPFELKAVLKLEKNFEPLRNAEAIKGESVVVPIATIIILYLL